MRSSGKVRRGAEASADTAKNRDGPIVGSRRQRPGSAQDVKGLGMDPSIWSELAAQSGSLRFAPRPSAETVRDLREMVENPKRLMVAKYHDAGSCWQLIEAALREIRSLRRTQASPASKKRGTRRGTKRPRL
jgi:hypothetical protein